jgi:hypothetical protein
MVDVNELRHLLWLGRRGDGQEDGTALHRWQHEYLEEIAPHTNGAAYVNYLFDEPARVAAAYHPGTWDRLRAIKGAWDPTNCFAANQNIPPPDKNTA